MRRIEIDAVSDNNPAARVVTGTGDPGWQRGLASSAVVLIIVKRFSNSHKIYTRPSSVT